MLKNIEEDFFYALLPPVATALDVRLLVQAVSGGLQDRVGDNRFYVSNMASFMDPWEEPPRTILVNFIQQNQQELTIPLTDDGTAPEDGDPALLTWCATQLNLDDPTRVLAAVTGTDALRILGVDQIELLADSLGATLYPGLANELPEERTSRRQQIVQSFFPRLKIKGTARSFSALARLCGYDDGVLTPLWSRLSPRSPDLAVVSITDFNAKPDFYPTAVLPDPFYDPSSQRDGPWYQWQSGSLYPDSTNPANFYTSVNGRNPFINILQQGTAPGVIQTGTYVLTGGARQAYASVLFNSGLYTSNLSAQALVPGASLNGLQVVVSAGNGVWRQMSVEDQLSSIKYRSSYFDASVTLSVERAGSLLIEANPDLQNGLVTSDGTATAPWRPWTGGFGQQSAHALWPEKIVVPITTTTVSRNQAPINYPQLDIEELQSGAARILGLAQADTLAATRTPRYFGAGLLSQDTTGFAAYPDTFVVTTAPGSYFGTLTPADRPASPFDLSFSFAGYAIPAETVGTQVYVESSYASGSYDLGANTYTLFSSGTGQLSLGFTKIDTTLGNSEPTPAQKSLGWVGYQNVPAGTYVTPAVSPLLQTSDDLPWQKIRILAGGDDAPLDVFSPFNGDPQPLTPVAEIGWLDVDGIPRLLRVMDTPGATQPYRVKSLDNPTPGPVNPAYGQAGAATFNNSIIGQETQSFSIATEGGAPLISNTTAAPLITVPLRLIGDMPVASAVLSEARTNKLMWWWPLNEASNTHLTAVEALSQKEFPWVNARWFERKHDPVYGWAMSTGNGVLTSPPISIPGAYSLGVRFKPTGPANTASFGPQVPVTVGQISLRVVNQGSAVAAFLATAPGTQVSTGTVRVGFGLPNYVYASYQNGQLSLMVRQNGTGTFSGTSVGAPSPLNTSPYVVIGAADPITVVQDLSVWGGTKTVTDLTLVDTPNFVQTAVATSLPFSYSLQGDRYTFNVLAQGFVEPGQAHPNATSSFESSTVVRYGGDGGYDGDPRFKRVGLGENQPYPAVYQLGLTSTNPIMAHGQAVIVGTQTALPAFTHSFSGTPGKIDIQGPPYGPNGGTVTAHVSAGSLWATDMNNVLDHIYLKGNDGSVYDCYLDNLGSGPVFVSEAVLRPRAYPAGTIQEDPTDHVAVFQSGTATIVAANNTVISQTTSAGTGYPDNFYMYMNSQLVANVQDPVARWANPNPFGMAQGVAALDGAGELTFVMTEFSPGPTPLELNFLVGNIGQVDDAFAGFDVQVVVEGPGIEPIIVPAILLPEGFGYNPQAWQTVSVPLPTSLSGTWLITLRWTNDRVVKSRGWARQLAIFQFVARSMTTSLAHVTINPFMVSGVSVFSPVAPLQAGAWVAHVTNSGTVYPATHESQVFSPIIDNPFNYTLRPGADSLTGTSARRFSDLRTVNPYVKASTPVTPPPVINSVGIVPLSAYYNVGQPITLSANVQATGPRYVWELWDSGTTATITPTITQNFISGGTKFAQLTVVDQVGQTATWSGSFIVNSPPLISALVATPNDQVAPYFATLSAFVSDTTPVNFSWRTPSGSVFATGTTVPNYPVTQSGYVNGVAMDTFGGTSTVALYIAAEQPSPPIISIADYTSSSKTSFPNTLSFAAMGIDPQGRPLTPLWSFWDGFTTSGAVTAMPGFGNGSLFTTTRTLNQPSPGYMEFSLTLTDSIGLTANAGAGVQFNVNSTPVITSALSTEPAITTGQPLMLSARAIDPDGDTLNYTWKVSPLNVVLYGPDVSVDTSSLTVGSTVTASITVDDGFGGVVSTTLPGLPVNAAGLNTLYITPPSGDLTGGINVSIVQPTNFNTVAGGVIRYTVNGADPRQPTDGLPYTGPFQVTGVAGKTVIVKARAFQTGLSPTTLATVTYQF